MVSLKHISHYKDIVWLLLKYGNKDFVQDLDIEITDKPKEIGNAQELAKDLQSLGPTFIKLGQFLSTQVEFLPDEYQEVLSNLQDHAETFSFEHVKEIVEEELGIEIKKAFLEFDEKPLAAASLSQVHKAILHSGKPVVVKVQRPGIRKKILDDLDAMEELARYLDKKEVFGKYFYWEDRIKSFRHTLINELDFRKEAQNLKIFARNLREFELIIVPVPVDDYTTSCVLTMEYVSSKKITTLHPLLKIEINGTELAQELFKAYLKQIFVDGFVHIDPHPGNVYITDSQQIALLDSGMVEYIPKQLQADLLKMLIAISEGKGEEVADLVIKLGHKEEEFDYFTFRTEVADLVAQNHDLNFEKLSVGRLLLMIARIASQKALRLPQKFNTLGKMLLNVDSIIKTLAPDLNPFQFIQNNLNDLLQRRIQNLVSRNNFTKLFLEVTDLLEHLPTQINNFLDLLSKNEFRLKIQALDEHRLMRGFEKIANRITLGLIIAAAIIGAALLMRVETPYSLFGYPALAILLFIFAFGAAILFAYHILMHDEKNKKN